MAIPKFQHEGRPVVMRAHALSTGPGAYFAVIQFREFDTQGLGPQVAAFPVTHIPAADSDHALRIVNAINNDAR